MAAMLARGPEPAWAQAAGNGKGKAGARVCAAHGCGGEVRER